MDRLPASGTKRTGCRAAKRRGGRRLCAAIAIAALAWVWVGLREPARADCPRPEVWVASTRRLPGICRMPTHAALTVERLSGGDRGRWERSSVAEMLGGGDVPLVVFVHGNLYRAADAKSTGLLLAQRIAAARPDAGPVRTIVFSWPSERQGLLIRDVRMKYERASADGHYLAWLLGQVDPGRDLAVVGYSYGALVGLEAFRDLAGAERAGRPGATPWAGRAGRTNLVLVAPAVRCDALAPRGPYRAALAPVDRLTILANSADRALWFFPWIDRCAPARALGVTSMPRRWLPSGVEFCAVDAAGVVGWRHFLPHYLAAAPLVRRIATGAVGGLGAAVDGDPPARR